MISAGGIAVRALTQPYGDRCGRQVHSARCCGRPGGAGLLRTCSRQLLMPGITMFGSTVELSTAECQQQRYTREGHRFRTKRGPYTSETKLVAPAIVLDGIHKRTLGVLSRYEKARYLPCAMCWRARICRRTCERELGLMGESRAPAAQSTMANAPQLEQLEASLQQPPAAMIEICRCHSSMLQRSGISMCK